MLSFRHGQETITLQPGGSWSSRQQGETYRDTAADTLHTIIDEVTAGRPWREAVAQRYEQAQPWLHRIVTSPARSRFFWEFPPAPGSRVLDIGAGWGQIALPLAKNHGADVTALEPTPERLGFIRAAAAQEGVTGRLRYIEADFLELEFDPVFDLACCIGVLEWVPRFRPGEPRTLQLDFLRRIRATLKPGGRCCVGIENRLGLKYLLGARDDHTGQSGISCLDAALAARKHLAATGQELRAFTYTLAEYGAMFREAGFSRMETYAAFPDYKLPELILPIDPPMLLNEHLLHTPPPPEHDGCDGHVLPGQEVFASHYQSLARMGLAQHFSPSFFFLLQ
jgi:2-polyprenyl-3-methyl-5-hydroxy-6-metoxy-1,4-benzoquinol methylase